MTTIAKLCGMVVFLLALPWSAAAQEGRIEGRVTELSGGVVVGASVSLIRVDGGASLSTARSDAEGGFSFTGLLAGTYVIRVDATGFQQTARRATVQGDGSVRIDVMLPLGGLAESVTVFGSTSSVALDTPSETGSRLGLTPREIPGSLELVTQATIQSRGHRTVQEAVASAVGVTVGDHPADNSSFTTRGFTQTQVPVFYEGARIPVAMAFPMDAWNLERLEVLKGPGSSLYGEGAVGGTINFVFKRPDRQPQRAEGMLSYGGFNTRRLGLGAGGPIGQSSVHYRADYSLNESDGYIDRTPSTLHNLTTAIAWDASSAFDVQLSFDASSSDFSSYWGTPLVPIASAVDPIEGIVDTDANETIDRPMSRVNYNADGDIVTEMTTYWTQARLRYQPTTGVTIRNTTYYTPSDREWRNSEFYDFNPETNMVDRDRFFVSHHVTLTGNRTDLAVTRPIGRLANRFLAGLEVSAMRFDRVPFFRGGVDSVDRFNPTPGVFGPLTPTFYSQQEVDTAAFFVEDYLSLRSNVKVALSLRAEHLDVNHFEFSSSTGVPTHRPSGGELDAASSFGRVFTPVTWRAGLIYDARPGLNLYANVATSADPVNADLIYGAPENFDLSRGVQAEVGVRQAYASGRGEWTVAYYWIERRNLLTATSPISADAVGKQSSRGVELSAIVRPTTRWQLQGTAALLDARFDEFEQNIGGVLVSRNGNRPQNIPNVVVDLRTSYRFGDQRPVDVTALYRHVGDRFNGLDNSARMLGYDVVDLFATWTLESYHITARVRNLFDEQYASWGSNYYTAQVSLGMPRAAEVVLGFRF